MSIRGGTLFGWLPFLACLLPAALNSLCFTSSFPSALINRWFRLTGDLLSFRAGFSWIFGNFWYFTWNFIRGIAGIISSSLFWRSDRDWTFDGPVWDKGHHSRGLIYQWNWHFDWRNVINDFGKKINIKQKINIIKTDKNNYKSMKIIMVMIRLIFRRFKSNPHTFQDKLTPECFLYFHV